MLCDWSKPKQNKLGREILEISRSWRIFLGAKQNPRIFLPVEYEILGFGIQNTAHAAGEPGIPLTIETARIQIPLTKTWIQCLESGIHGRNPRNPRLDGLSQSWNTLFRYIVFFFKVISGIRYQTFYKSLAILVSYEDKSGYQWYPTAPHPHPLYTGRARNYGRAESMPWK